MTVKAIRAALAKAPRRRVALVLTNGVSLPVPHSDFVAFSPDTPEIIVYGEGGGFSVVALAEIASIEVGVPKSPSATS